MADPGRPAALGGATRPGRQPDRVPADGAAADGGLLARTPWGVARGVEVGGSRVWRGVPYAAAPLGPARFRPPVPPTPWKEERDCSAYGPTSPQLRAPSLRAAARHRRAARGSEDCLTLNIAAPASAGPARPVLVWVHGGGFVSGAGSSYDATRLAARTGTVVITVNYRLGPWGFLDLTPPGARVPGAGNLALLDVIQALRWVRDTAEAFGGDPGQVTIFGESAGAMIIGALLAAPAARELAHRAVLMSGSPLAVRDQASAERARNRYLALLGRDPAQATTADLLEAAEALLAEPGGGEAFLPTADTTVIPADPLGAIGAGACRDVPLLATWCRDEAALFLTLAEGALPAAREARYAATLGPARWEALRSLYTAQYGDAASARSALLTDAMFGVPALRLAAAAHAGGGAGWALRFDHAVGGPGTNGIPRPVGHGADLPLTWGRADPASTDPDRRVAAHWQDILATFARTGTPSAPGLPAWPVCAPETETTLLLGSEPRVVDHPGGRRHAAWAGVAV